MDGANVEIVQEVGADNAVIFGLSSDEVIRYENEGGYDPMEIFNNDQDIREVLMELINGKYSKEDPEMFRDIYNSLFFHRCNLHSQACTNSCNIQCNNSRYKQIYGDKYNYRRTFFLSITI